MHPVIRTWLFFALAAKCISAALAIGGVLELGAPCFEACQTTLKPVKFTDVGANASKLVHKCQSRYGLTSLYLCTAVFCSNEEQTAGLDGLNSTCQAYLQSPIPPLETVSNYTDEDLLQLRKLEREDYEGNTLLGEPAIPSDHYFGLAYDTLYSWAYVYRYHIRYGYAMFIFWGVVISIGLLYRTAVTLSQEYALKQHRWKPVPIDELGESGGDPATKNPNRTSRPYVWLKKYMILPAAFGYRSAQPFGWYTVPPRIQSLTIGAFIVINIVFCIHGYQVFPDNLYWPKVSDQVWRFVSDRTGIISFANFPLIWIFGMRNNLLMWLTGWDFGTYSNFHRWVARVSTMQAIVHSIGYTYIVFQGAGWAGFVQYWDLFFWWTGEVATVIMSLLLGLSVYWLRRKTYELFLFIHILFSIIILASMWGHVSIFKGSYNPIIWVCCAVWILDRIMRVTRTLLFNPQFWSTRARATYDRDANMVRLCIPLSASLYSPRPGTFYYLHLLDDWYFWESHPFTMASVQIQDHSEAAIVEERECLLERRGSEGSSPTMNFLIRPYDSFTGRLRDAATESSSSLQPASLRVILEGPYGHKRPFHRFENLVFVVGGSGIVVPLAHMNELGKNTSRTRAIRIIWAVREAALATSVLRDDFGDLLDSDKLSIHVYITKDQPCELHKNARLLYGRPFVHEEVEDFVRYSEQGNLAVVACGPARMADDTRKAVVDLLGADLTRRPIEYFEESFNW
ncbi:ferric reductase like transmembrane component [Xylariales sp. AK1849]|nr:ferric reductase like transmembrane component [Xylariales sp. AK1849]